MNKLITADQVMTIAFNREISSEKILDSVILTAQYKFIRPVLTEDLYDLFEADPAASTYATLKTFTDQALAWYVKYLALPELFVELTDRGIKYLDGLNATSIDDQRFIDYREHILVIAEDKIKQLTEHLYDSDYTGYISSKNPDNNIIIAGNIIFPQENNPWGEDDDDQWNDHL